MTNPHISNLLSSPLYKQLFKMIQNNKEKFAKVSKHAFSPQGEYEVGESLRPI